MNTGIDSDIGLYRAGDLLSSKFPFPQVYCIQRLLCKCHQALLSCNANALFCEQTRFWLGCDRNVHRCTVLLHCANMRKESKLNTSLLHTQQVVKMILTLLENQGKERRGGGNLSIYMYENMKTIIDLLIFINVCGRFKYITLGGSRCQTAAVEGELCVCFFNSC